MIERVARAMAASASPSGDAVWSEMTQAGRSIYLAFARSAITAMRVPTFEMLQAADHEETDRSHLLLFEIWRAMIDAALGD